MFDNLDQVTQQLSQWLQRQGEPLSQVTGLRPSSGGFSNITLLGTLASPDGAVTRDVVVRVQPQTAAVYPNCDIQLQYRTMQLLQGSGLPVPTLHGLELDSSVLGAPFFIMGRIEGRVPQENPLYHLEGWLHDLPAEAVRTHWFSGLQGVAQLAKLDWRALGFDFLLPPAGTTPLQHQLRYYERMLAWSESLSGQHYELLHSTLQWLQANQPASSVNGPLALSWGDAKLGNCVFAEDGSLAGMLDWEQPAIAHPVEDLAWWLMLDESLSLGYGLPRLAALPSRQESVAYWEQATGYSAADLPYYEIFAALRFSVVMSRIGHIFTERGYVKPELQMDRHNGGSQLLRQYLLKVADAAPASV